MSQGYQCFIGRGLEKPRYRGKGRILTKSEGMLRRERSVRRSDLYFVKLFADSGGRTEETPSRLLEAEEVDDVSRQPAEQQLQRGQLPPPHPRLPHPHPPLSPRPLLLPQPQHQPRQRAESHLCSSFRTQQPQIERGLPQRASAQTTGRIPVSSQLAVPITFLESNIFGSI